MTKTFDLSQRPAGIAPQEWESRVQLAACYRVVDLLGWSEIVVNHLAARARFPGAFPHQSLRPHL